jgi:DNA-binding CsgD family transcriptional regulator
MERETLIDRIYEAAVVPEFWPGILDDIAALAGCVGGILFTTVAAGRVGRWTSSRNLREFMQDFLSNEEVQANNIRLPRFSAAKHHGFLGNDRLYDRDVMERNLAYREFFFPKGFGYCAGTIIPMPNGDMAGIDLERRHADGPVSDNAIAALDGIRPHLCRAAVIGTRLSLERAKTVVDALENAGLPAAVLAKDGRALAVNRRLERLSSQFAFLAHDRTAIMDRKTNALFCEAVERVGSAAATRSIPVAAVPGSPAAVAHVLPLPGQASDIFYRAHALLVVTQLDRPSAPAAELLSGLFDLTPAEGRVARSISLGKTIEQTALGLGLSRETVRWHLKAIFTKTGVSRQAELGALLSGIVLHGSGP